MYNDLKNKVAIVTASTSGIALAAVRMLAADGARVFMAARNLEKAQALADEMNAVGGHVQPVKFKGGDLSTFEPMVNTVVEKARKIDILINSLGGYADPIADYAPGDLGVAESTAKAMRGCFERNVVETSEVCRLVIPHMIKNGGGSIVNNASLTANQIGLIQTYYGLTKDGVNYLTRSIAAQYGRYGIRCNSVCPGFIGTPGALAYLPKEFINAWLKHTPLYRLGKPEDIAKAMLFFASDQSEWVTGQVLEVSGGHGIGCPTYGDDMIAQGLNPATNPEFKSTFDR